MGRRPISCNEGSPQLVVVVIVVFVGVVNNLLAVFGKLDVGPSYGFWYCALF